MITLPPKRSRKHGKVYETTASYIGHIVNNCDPERKKTSMVSPMNSPEICLEIYSGPWYRVDHLSLSRIQKSYLIGYRNWDSWSLTQLQLTGKVINKRNPKKKSSRNLVKGPLGFILTSKPYTKRGIPQGKEHVNNCKIKSYLSSHKFWRHPNSEQFEWRVPVEQLWHSVKLLGGSCICSKAKFCLQ